MYFNNLDLYFTVPILEKESLKFKTIVNLDGAKANAKLQKKPAILTLQVV